MNTHESRDALQSFILFLAVISISKLNIEHRFELEMETFKKLAVVVHVLQTTQSLVISRCCFAEGQKKFTVNYDTRVQLFCSPTVC